MEDKTAPDASPTPSRRAELRRAELRRAELRRAELCQAELRQAELRRAELSQQEAAFAALLGDTEIGLDAVHIRALQEWLESAQRELAALQLPDAKP